MTKISVTIKQNGQDQVVIVRSLNDFIVTEIVKEVKSGSVVTIKMLDEGSNQ